MKHKTQLKQSKGKRKSEQALETADDYQAAGVDLEEAGGKWRAGDPSKSMRFFEKAINVYQEGLSRFPRSLDLAYNKARVQYEIASHPLLVRQLSVPVSAALETALISHRYALELDPEVPDTLFNTAQVMTSIAEDMMKDSQSTGTALGLLEEALELQNRCLNMQELKLEQDQERQQEAAQLAQESSTAETSTMGEDVESQTSSDVAQQEEQWFSVQEPITIDTLIDTVLAQLSTLTALCEVLSSTPSAAPPATLPWIEEYSTKLLNSRLPSYTAPSSERLGEIALTKAIFLSALLEAGFRSGKLNGNTYKTERDGAFAVKEIGLETSVPALLANAQSLMSFASALADLAADSTHASIRWDALSAAISNLSTGSKVQSDQEDLVKTHLLRGDCSLLQYQLGHPPISYSTAKSNAPQLLKNAEVFYRNATKLSRDKDEQQIAALRSAVAAGLATRNFEQCIMAAVGSLGQEWINGQLNDMIDEDLLSEEYRPA